MSKNPQQGLTKPIGEYTSYNLSRILQKRTDQLLQKPFLSPRAVWAEKANILCETYRKAKGYNEKLSACTNCRIRCVVEDGNF
jgi:hypothetical protein